MHEKIAAAVESGELFPALDIVEACSRKRQRRGLTQALHLCAAGEQYSKAAQAVPASDKVLFARLAQERPGKELTAALESLAAQRNGFSSAVFTPYHKVYPHTLRQSFDMPEWLFWRGDLDLLLKPAVAIVGSRACSHYGKELATWITTDLAALGLVVISGMAEGIDAAAHRAALAAGGDTIAVLGNGFDFCFPQTNRRLMADIAEKGLLLSEYPASYPPQNYRFPERNRIVAALAAGVLVIDAQARSGALITAKLAAELGRSVMAVPGSVKSATSKGAHKLLREGACLVESAQDIVRELKEPLIRTLPVCEDDPQVSIMPELDESQKKVLQSIDWEGTPLDVIATRTSRSSDQLLAVLTQLELTSCIVGLGWGYRRLV